MSYSDRLLEGTKMTEQSILQDLETLSLYYEDANIPSRTIQATRLAPLPSLVAMLDGEEEGASWVLTNSFLPLDGETAEFTKYLQFYCELPGSLDGVELLTLLEGVSRINQALPFGTALVVAPRPELKLPRMAAVRTVQGFPLNRPIDQGVFTEDVLLFEMSCQMVNLVMNALREGRTVDEALEQLHQ